MFLFLNLILKKPLLFLIIKVPECIELFGDWPNGEKEKFISDMVLHTNFLTTNEEESIFGELEPYLKRMKYEFDHWDDVSFVFTQF